MSARHIQGVLGHRHELLRAADDAENLAEEVVFANGRVVGSHQRVDATVRHHLKGMTQVSGRSSWSARSRCSVTFRRANSL
jgi:hypothetical protein